MFKTENRNLKFDLKDGLQVVTGGRLSVYDKQGKYQLYVESLEPKGLGALQLAFEQLKQRLAKEGLFDPAHKKPIPVLPAKIGIVTSPTGAAIRDILNILKRRFSNVEVIINPVKVQGEGAAEEIACAIQEFNDLRNVEVLIVTRGGGSLEDLWEFNEEVVARAIYNSKIPVISAVGHEIDWTIADFVSDLRAPTPSAAAELVIGEKQKIVSQVSDLFYRLKRAFLNKIDIFTKELYSLEESYALRQPMNFIKQRQQDLDELIQGLDKSGNNFINFNTQRLIILSNRLEGLSPLSVLSRGYSLSLRLPSKEIIKEAKILKKGDLIETKVAKGNFISEVKEVK
jgi:exodeoxyribonuclease VII large subunit